MSFFSLFLNVQQISITSYSYPFQLDTISVQILSASPFIVVKLHCTGVVRQTAPLQLWLKFLGLETVGDDILITSVCAVLVVVTVTSQIWTRDQFWHWQHRKYFIKNIWSIVRKSVVAIAAVSLMQCMMDVVEEVLKCEYSRRWRKEPDSGSGSGEI